MNAMHALARQQVSWDQEHATIEAGKRAFTQPMSAAEHWGFRAFYIAIAAAGIGYSILGAAA